MKLKSKQEGIVLRNAKNPRFHIRFEGEPVEVTTEIGQYIVEEYPNLFEVEGNVSSPEVNDWLQELQDIKGIGVKMSKDIYNVYPTKASLIHALEQGQDLPYRDDIVEKLKESFGGN